MRRGWLYSGSIPDETLFGSSTVVTDACAAGIQVGLRELAANLKAFSLLGRRQPGTLIACRALRDCRFGPEEEQSCRDKQKSRYHLSWSPSRS
jgi:hypothetical protein